MMTRDITKENISIMWQRFAQMSSDLEWDYWQEEHFLKDLVMKWSLSFYVNAEEPEGYCIASEKEECVWLHHLVVSPNGRGKGAGSMMLSELEKRTLRLTTKKSISLKVRIVDDKAISFYQKNGYVFVESNGEYSVMTKELRENIVSIHQPNYVPWTGYFYKIFLSNIFVLLDDVQYTKNSFINRNRIKGSQGEQWLTVPVNGSVDLNINEVGFADSKWMTKHIKTLDLCYKKAPYYEQYRSQLHPILSAEYDTISELNINLIKEIVNMMGLKTEIVSSSSLGITEVSDDRLIQIVKRMNGQVYLSGFGGKKYQDESKFITSGINLRYYNFKPLVYDQLWGEFIPGLSILDMIFNVGISNMMQWFTKLTEIEGDAT